MGRKSLAFISSSFFSEALSVEMFSSLMKLLLARGLRCCLDQCSSRSSGLAERECENLLSCSECKKDQCWHVLYAAVRCRIMLVQKVSSSPGTYTYTRTRPASQLVKMPHVELQGATWDVYAVLNFVTRKLA